MALARFERTIVDQAGNVIPSPFIEVRREIVGAPLASLYSDRDGATPIGNPFQVATADGLAAFHAVGGAYRIRAYWDGDEITWRYVGVSTGSEVDFGIQFVPSGAWAIGTTYAESDLVEHNGYIFASNEDANLGNEPDDSPASTTEWTWIPAGVGPQGIPGSSDVVGTSTSSVAIGTGAKTFAIAESDRGWGVGARLRVTSAASPTTHWMEGVVTSYAASSLQITSDLIAGSGSRADWTINLAGEPGEEGAAGGDFTVRQITAAGAVTVTGTDEIILLNKTVGAATNVNFPAAAAYTGRGISLKDIKGDAATNNITPVFNGAETCDGLAGSEFVISVNYGEQGVFRPLPSGAGWYIHRR